MATHSSIIAWEILWTEEPHRLQSMGSQIVRHDLGDLAAVSTNGIPVPSPTPYISSSWENNSLHFWYQSE